MQMGRAVGGRAAWLPKSPLRGLLPGRWGVIQRLCPGGFHVQGAGQWLVAEGSGANWCKTLQKPQEMPAESSPVQKGSLAAAEGLLLGSASMISAVLPLTSKCLEKIEASMCWDLRFFSLRGLLLRWPKKALAVRPLFPKSNARNNSRTDGS